MEEINGVVVLAAGFSRRFGGDKLSAQLGDGRTVLGQTLDRLEQASKHILVVTRAELRQSLSPSLPSIVSVALCDDARLGMGQTLAFGISQVRHWRSCLVCLGDMPFITTESYRQLLQTLATGPEGTIVQPSYQGRPGNPVGFHCDWFAELTTLRGDRGARDLIRSAPAGLRRISLDDPAILQDVDTPEGLAAARPG